MIEASFYSAKSFEPHCARGWDSTRAGERIKEMPLPFWKRLKSASKKLQSQTANAQATANALKPPVDATTPEHLSPEKVPPKDLWDRAYKLLRDDRSTRGLLESYEKILLSEIKDGIASQTLPASFESFDRQPQLAALVSKKLQAVDNARWRFHIRDETIEVKAQVDRLVKAVLFAKDFVSSAVSSEPHAALAWTGVCVLLPVRFRQFSVEI